MALSMIISIIGFGLGEENADLGAASYGAKTSSIYQPFDDGCGSGSFLSIQYPEFIDSDDTNMDVTYSIIKDVNTVYEAKLNGETVSLGLSFSGTQSKTISYTLDGSDIDGEDSTRYKISVNNVMYCSGGKISQGTATLYIGINNSDETPPLITGATAVYLNNVDSPNSVATFKSTLTATDETDGDLTSAITVSRDLYTGNEDVLGDHEVDFTVEDSSGNSTTMTIIFRVVDVVDPIINLVGGTVYVEYPSTFNEPGYSVTDNFDTDLSVSVSGSVTNDTLGNYTLYYNATDSSGNSATQRTRLVVVQDTTSPVQTLSGPSNVYVEFGDNFTDSGATWTDAYDGSGSSVVTGSVNVGVLGTYNLYYNITDSNGNVATQLTRTVVVRDTTAPGFVGETDYTFNTGNPFALSVILDNITASDIYDGDVTSSISIKSDNYTGNESIKGVYTVVLEVEDSQMLNSEYTITITVIDNTPPEFSTSANLYTLDYANSLSVEQMRTILGLD